MPRMPQMPGMRPVDRCRSVASAEPTGNDEHPTRKKKIIIIQRNHWIRFLFFSFLGCFFLGFFFFLGSSQLFVVGQKKNCGNVVFFLKEKRN